MSAPENTEKTRILVLEEHPLLRHGITDYLDSQPDMIVCGEADNIRDARNKLAECKPQLLVTALRLGTGDSLEFVRALKAEHASLLILVYSSFEETIFVECDTKYVEEHFLPPKKDALPAVGKKKLVRFPAA